jgi:hypothetical protein
MVTGSHHPDLSYRELSAAAARSKTYQVWQVTEDIGTNESEVISSLRETHSQAPYFRLTLSPRSYSDLSASSCTMLSMNRLDYNRLIAWSFTGISDLLKNSASYSASPRLRVEIHSLDDPPLTPPLAQLPKAPANYERPRQPAR